jgi:hypothetical protein
LRVQGNDISTSTIAAEEKKRADEVKRLCRRYDMPWHELSLDSWQSAELGKAGKRLSSDALAVYEAIIL